MTTGNFVNILAASAVILRGCCKMEKLECGPNRGANNSKSHGFENPKFGDSSVTQGGASGNSGKIPGKHEIEKEARPLTTRTKNEAKKHPNNAGKKQSLKHSSSTQHARALRAYEIGEQMSLQNEGAMGDSKPQDDYQVPSEKGAQSDAAHTYSDEISVPAEEDGTTISTGQQAQVVLMKEMARALSQMDDGEVDMDEDEDDEGEEWLSDDRGNICKNIGKRGESRGDNQGSREENEGQSEGELKESEEGADRYFASSSGESKQTSNMPSVSEKNLPNMPNMKAFALVMFPELIIETGWEGWDSKSALDLFVENAEELKNLNALEGADVSVLEECIGTLGDAKASIDIEKGYNRECEDKIAFFNKSWAAMNYFAQEKLNKNDENKDKALQWLNEQKLSPEEISNLRKIWKQMGSPLDANKAKERGAFYLCGSLLDKPREIFSQLQNDGDCVYLHSGWTGNDSGHCAYILLERKGGKIYAHEMNLGGGFRTSRNKSSMYAKRAVPGRTIELLNEESFLFFVAKNFELHHPDSGKNSSLRVEEYQAMWDLGKLVSNPSSLGRPKFTDYSQRSGNCPVKSVDVLFRTVLQRAMAKNMKKSVNSPEVVHKAYQLYRLHAIHTRVQLVEKYFNWHETHPNEIDLDSLDMLRRGVSRLGYYVNRYFNKLEKEEKISEEKLQLLRGAVSLCEKVDKYLKSPERIRIRQRPESREKISASVPPKLAKTAKTKAMEHAKVIVETGNFKKNIHFTLNLKQIKVNPSVALENVKFIAGKIGEQDEIFYRRELINQACELLRVIPLPNESDWENYISKLNPSQRREFTKHIGKILKEFVDIPAVKKFLREGANSLDSQLIDRENVSFPHCELGQIVNAITKARIITFELAKEDPFLGNLLRDTGKHPDHAWFETFCNSAVNFTANSTDRDEQIRLWKYVSMHKSESPLFEYTEQKNLKGSDFNEATVIFYKNVFDHLTKGKDLDNSLWNSNIPNLGLLRTQPGLCLGWKFDGAESVLSKLEEMFAQDQEMKEAFDALNDFRLTMAYHGGWDLYVRWGSGSNICETGLIAKKFPDPFGRLGSGYELYSENRDVIFLAEQPDAIIPLIRRQIGVELSRPEEQTCGMLQLLGDHLELCDKFYALENFASDLDVWLQAFNRTLYNGQYPGGDYEVKQPESPLYNTAKARPKELLGAIRKLWDRGKNELWDLVPDKQPLVKHLCALVHVAYLARKNVIAANGSGKIIGQVQTDLNSMLEDIGRICKEHDSTLTFNERMLLRLAENECIAGYIDIAQKDGGTVDSALLVKLYENTFHLQGFDSKGLPKGCSEVIYRLIPSLGKYWEEHGDQAKDVAIGIRNKLFPNNQQHEDPLFPVANGIGQFEDESKNYVDLVNLKICISGRELKGATCVFENKDYQRLFLLPNAKGSREVVAIGDQYKFADDRYGQIAMIKVGEIRDARGAKVGDDFKIYRHFEDSNAEWCYVAPTKVSSVNLSSCFGGDDFTTWVSKEGKFRICEKDNPCKILYETDDAGRLCDVERKKLGSKPYYISFCEGPNFPARLDEFSRFEDKNYTLFYYNDSNEILEAAFPRYRTDGGILRFIRSGNEFGVKNWVLASNRNYKLINAPTFSVGRGQPATEQNVLLGYDNALWLENVDPKSAGVFKCLLPDAYISRGEYMTHRVLSEATHAKENKVFFGSSQCAEASLYDNILDFVAPNLRAYGPLNGLRLAHIFQTQGEYELALKFLSEFSTDKEFTADEVAMIRRMVWWFKDGKEKNGAVALVIFTALSRALQNPHFRENNWDLILEIVKRPPLRSSLFEELAGEYFIGFDLYSQQMQMDYKEEKLFWENMNNVLKTIEKKIEKKPQNERETIGYPSGEVASRIKHLKQLIEDSKVNSKTFIRDAKKRENDPNKHDLVRENMIMRENNNVRIDADAVSFEFSHVEPSAERKVCESLGSVLTQEKPDTYAQFDNVKQLTPFISENDKRMYGSNVKSIADGFNEDLKAGACELQEIEHDRIAQKVPKIETVERWSKVIGVQLATASKERDEVAKEISELANKNMYETMHGADVRKPLEIPDALRVYGIFASGGNDAHSRVLEYLKNNFPWFPMEKLGQFLGHVEAYLVNATSARHLAKIKDALGSLYKEADASKRSNIWYDTLQLLRQTRNGIFNASKNDELNSNMLLFEYMTELRPREDQFEKIKFIIDKVSDPECDYGALIQQIMSSGKTKVLLPFVITLLLNRSDSLPIVVSHISQLPAVMLELPKILSGVGIRVDEIDMDFSQFFNPLELRQFRKLLTIAFARRDRVPVLTSHTLLALHTAYRALSDGKSDMSENTRRELYVEFDKLFHFFEEKGIGIMDEVHLTLNPREAFIVEAGSNPFDKNTKISEVDVTSMVDFIHGLPEKIIKKIRDNVHDQIPAKALKECLIEYVREEYAEKLFHISGPGDIGKNFAEFICGEFDGDSAKPMPDPLKRVLENLPPEFKHRVNLLRKLCSNTLIHCLSKVYGEHFGYNERGEIVPFRNRLPTDSHYQDPHEVLCYYIMATLIRGVPETTLINYIENLAAAAKSQTVSGKIFDETNQAIFFENLFNGKVDDVKRLSEMRKAIVESEDGEDALEIADSQTMEANWQSAEKLKRQVLSGINKRYTRMFEDDPLEEYEKDYGELSKRRNELYARQSQELNRRKPPFEISENFDVDACLGELEKANDEIEKVVNEPPDVINAAVDNARAMVGELKEKMSRKGIEAPKNSHLAQLFKNLEENRFESDLAKAIA
ncbi:MAG: hypothetical protein LBS87_02605, partial [Puniceicoccales bacterium]|nr:hypothetical protein [Puniceicoccales bacterium]